MQRHMVPALVGISIFPLAAAGIAAYLMAAGVMLVAVALLMLAVGMILAAVMIMVRLSHQDNVLADQQVVQDELEARIKTAAARLVGLEEQSRRSTAQATRAEEIMTELNALRREVKDLVQAQRQATAAAPPPATPAAAAAAPPSPAEPPAGRDELTLWLEPVIELASGNTSHYRAQIGLTDGAGKTVSHDDVTQKADQGGLRPSLDARLVKMVIPVLRRLRMRNPGLRVFVPVGRDTLAAREDVVRILSLLRRDGDLTDGIVFDLAQQDLGRLDAGGIENLARLGRSGAMLSVSSADPGGLDLTALRKLGVNYLSFAADAGSGSAWSGLAKTARVLNIDIVIAAIRTQQQAAAAAKLGRYGHGPHFAPPRKVRADAGIAAAPARRASAA
jgi:EAL domain-containing protein (putative c-di-GMP-specific phosphodiesterase class I)